MGCEACRGESRSERRNLRIAFLHTWRDIMNFGGTLIRRHPLSGICRNIRAWLHSSNANPGVCFLTRAQWHFPFLFFFFYFRVPFFMYIP